MNELRELIKDFIKEEDGIGVVEIILILVILIGLVLIFKSQIETLVNNILDSITSNSKKIYDPKN
ncbi:MAG: hypothetical protein K0S41_171 [Anaerocolumna sp.]|jgi:Flp pilus assembly pilin Flp|nr:hypothetical protein [Anaerocolumna sp.]